MGQKLKYKKGLFFNTLILIFYHGYMELSKGYCKDIYKVTKDLFFI